MSSVPKGLLPPRDPESHKGTHGYLAVVAGSVGMAGAAYLCAQAALRTGAGLVSLGTPAKIHDVLAAKLNEAMVYPMPCADEGVLNSQALEPILDWMSNKTAAVLGPGLSQEPPTRELLFRLLEKIQIPALLDADALNCLSQDPNMFKSLRGKKIIITPHPGEMARLLKWSTGEVQKRREEAARLVADKWGYWVVLKGHGTVVAGPGTDCYVNETGNPGMATGGTGDVLSGMIGALMAQGLNFNDAAVLGVYLHGAAGDTAAKEVGEIGLIAGDIIARIPSTIRVYQALV